MPDLVQFQAQKTVSAVFLARMGIPIQVRHMVEMMEMDFNEHQASYYVSSHHRKSTWIKEIDGGIFEKAEGFSETIMP